MAKVDPNAPTEQKQEKQTEQTEEEPVFVAEVKQLYNRAGSGGNITLCRVELRHNRKTIVRSVEGPVRVGDLLSLRECVRESRRSR